MQSCRLVESLNSEHVLTMKHYEYTTSIAPVTVSYIHKSLQVWFKLLNQILLMLIHHKWLKFGPGPFLLLLTGLEPHNRPHRPPSTYKGEEVPIELQLIGMFGQVFTYFLHKPSFE